MSAEKKSALKRKSFLLNGHGCRHREWVKRSTGQRLEPQGSDEFKITTLPCHYGVDASVSVFPSAWFLNDGGIVMKKNATVPSMVRQEKPPSKPPRRERSLPQPPIHKNDSSHKTSSDGPPRVQQTPVVANGTNSENAIPGGPLRPKDASRPAQPMTGRQQRYSAPVSLNKLTLREGGTRPIEESRSFSNSSTELWHAKTGSPSTKINDGTDVQRKASTITPVMNGIGSSKRLLPGKRLLVAAERRETAKRSAIAVPSDGPNKTFVRSLIKAVQLNGKKSPNAILDQIRPKMKLALNISKSVNPSAAPLLEKKIPEAPPRVERKSQLINPSKNGDPKPRPTEIRKKMNEQSKSKDTSRVSRPKGQEGEGRKSPPVQVSKDTSQVERIWKGWNAVLAKENPDLGKLMTDAKIFQGLSALLTHSDAKRRFPSKLVIEHLLIWPAGSYCFSRLISIIEVEAEASEDVSSQSIQFKNTASILNRLLSYMVELAASALRLSDEASMKQSLFKAVPEFMERTRNEAKSKEVQMLPRSLKDLVKIAKREEESGRNCEIWKEIRAKSTSAFTDLKKLSADAELFEKRKIPPKPKQAPSPTSVDAPIPKKIPVAVPPRTPTVSRPLAPLGAEVPRMNGASAGRTKKKKTVRFGKSDPKLDKTMRGVAAKVDKSTLETVFMDSDRNYESMLLDPINAAQEEAVTERLKELTLKGTVQFYSLLSEYIRGCEKAGEIEAETGSKPLLLPPTAVHLADVRNLKVAGVEIDRERKERRLPGY